MAHQAGYDFILKYNSSGSTYIAVAGQTDLTFTINHETVDVTSKDDTSTANGGKALWRSQLNSAGLHTATISGSVRFDDSVNDSAIRGLNLQGTSGNWRIIVPGSNSDNMQGAFMCTTFEMTGAAGDAVDYNITLESAGVITETTLA